MTNTSHSARQPRAWREEVGAVATIFAAGVNLAGAFGCTAFILTTTGDLRVAMMVGALGFPIGAVALLRGLSRRVTC